MRKGSFQREFLYAQAVSDGDPAELVGELVSTALASVVEFLN